ncbi:MAG: Ig-like domain-containing protein, partial [Nanoarchaeota archaeon]|nr:Ig-like domain-containing protein [Nanoarchaeota archaeon]
MKKGILIIAMILLLSISIVSATTSFGYAVDSNEDGIGIAPNPAYEDEDIECLYDYPELTSTPIYTWYKNGVEQSISDYNVDESKLSVGDEWTCELSYMVYAGPMVGYYEVVLGDETVEIQAEEETVIHTNSAPTVTMDDITVTEGDIARGYASGSDADGDRLTYTFSSFQLDFDEEPVVTSGNYFKWQTGTGDAGEYRVLVRVSDGKGGSSYDHFTISVEEEVEEVTYSPRVSDVEITVTQGDLVDIDVDYADSLVEFLLTKSDSSIIKVFDRDSDEDELTYVFSSPLNRTRGTWKTTLTGPGVYTATLIVTDQDGNTGIGDITITVEEKADTETCDDLNENGICDDEEACPLISVDSETVTVTEGDLARFDVTISDADGDSLELTFESNNLDLEGSDMTIQNNYLKWQTEEGDAGVYTVTVTVNDGQCEEEITVTIIVEAEDEPTETCDDLN